MRCAVVEGVLDTPETFRAVVAATLEEGGYSSKPEDWDWHLWAALISVHVRDVKGALGDLAQFRDIVAAARTKAVEKGEAWLDSSRAEAVADAYTRAVYLWLSEVSGARAVQGSSVVIKLAAELAAVLEPNEAVQPAAATGDAASDMDAEASQATPDVPSTPPVPPAPSPPRTHALPLPFLTAWLHAERVTGTGHGSRIWAAMSGTSLVSTISGSPPRRFLDSAAYLALLKHFKSDPPDEGYRHLAAHVPAQARGGLLSAAAAHHRPDLALVLALLHACVPPPRPAADPLFRERRFDNAAGALVRAARYAAALRRNHLLPPPYPPFPRVRVTPGAAQYRIHPAEWRWVAACLRRHAEGDVSVPLSFPLASLSKPQAQEQDEVDAGEGVKSKSKLVQPLPAAAGTGMAVTHSATYDPVTARTSSEVSRLTPALVRVLADAIVCEARDRNPDAGGEYLDTFTDCMRPFEGMFNLRLEELGRESRPWDENTNTRLGRDQDRDRYRERDQEHKPRSFKHTV
jgi:hypothetical protein